MRSPKSKRVEHLRGQAGAIGRRERGQVGQRLDLDHELLRLQVLDTSLDEGYQAMAADPTREAEAQAWCHGLGGDMRDEVR